MVTAPTQSEEGQIADTAQAAEQLEAQGYTKCRNPRCDFWIAPEYAQQIGESGGQYKCQRCGLSQNINTVIGAHPDSAFVTGGGTHAGLGLKEMGDIAEKIVKDQGQVPGYGPIVWWSDTYNSPLDGATRDWGIEVKGVNWDAANLAFVPGNPTTKQAKNQQAEKMGLKGILGILVLLNFRTSKADLYLREMPLEPWRAGNGQMISGIARFRHHTAMQFVEEVPFDNPLMDPKSPAPEVVQGNESSFGGNYKDDIPF